MVAALAACIAVIVGMVGPVKAGVSEGNACHFSFPRIVRWDFWGYFLAITVVSHSSTWRDPR